MDVEQEKNENDFNSIFDCLLKVINEKKIEDEVILSALCQFFCKGAILANVRKPYLLCKVSEGYEEAAHIYSEVRGNV